MDIQYINITSYRGVSSNAEHFYGIIGNPEHVQEYLITDYIAKPISGVTFVDHGENVLRYYPSEEEAIRLFKKAYYGSAINHNRIDEMVKDGVNQFPNIISIVRAAKEKFPDSVLCFSIQGRREEFVKLVQNHKEFGTEVAKILGLINS